MDVHTSWFIILIIMGVVILISFAIAVICNSVLFGMVDRFREINRGIEVHGSQRGEAQIYRGIIIIVVAISIFFSDYWWAPIVGYIIGFIAGRCISNNDSEAYIIFFGKILKPVFLLVALICTFV